MAFKAKHKATENFRTIKQIKKANLDKIDHEMLMNEVKILESLVRNFVIYNRIIRES
jgi:hypothetical protein